MGQSAYVFPLERPANARIRVTLRTHEYRHRRAAGAASLAGRVQEWAVQLEWHDGEEGWVARYDTAGGRAHRDRNRLAAHLACGLPA